MKTGRSCPERGWESLATKAQAHEDADYGYLLWLMKQPVSDAAAPLPTMAGSGGNAVFPMPSKQVVVVITTTNYNERHPHLLTFRPLNSRAAAAPVIQRPRNR